MGVVPIFNLGNMAVYRQDLYDLIKPSVEMLGYQLWGCECFPQGRSTLLRVYLDAIEGKIGVADCERASRQISAILDVEDPIRGSYLLEVSSPGIERPLLIAEHYQEYVGVRARIKLFNPQLVMTKDKNELLRRQFEGVIASIEGDKVIFTLSGGDMIGVAFRNIRKANLIVENLLKRSGDRNGK